MLLSLLPPLLALVSLANAETKQFKTPDGISYTYDHVPAQNSQPTVLFVHGFPSGRQDWHHQIDNLTAEGYGIIAPDCLGYGDTDAPLDLESYNLRTIAGHFKALLDHEGVEQVVGVAHDWGVIILSHAAVWYPGSFDKLAFLSVGYNPPGRLDIDAANAQSLGQLGYTQLGYWYFFNTYDAEDVLFEHRDSYYSLVFPTDNAIWRDNLAMISGARAWLTANTATELAPYLTQDDRDEWMRRFNTRDSITSSLNYYRTIFAGTQASDAAQLTVADLVLRVPVMTIVGSEDAITTPEQIEAGTSAYATREYTAEVLQAGHWLMLEQPNAVNALLCGFMRG